MRICSFVLPVDADVDEDGSSSCDPEVASAARRARVDNVGSDAIVLSGSTSWFEETWICAIDSDNLQPIGQWTYRRYPVFAMIADSFFEIR